MKLLFDQNLSPRLADLLSDLFPDSNHVHRLGLDRAPDEEVWQHARREGFLIVTKDVDFSDLSLLLGSPPKVIWIRRGNCHTTDIEALLRHHHPDILALEKVADLGVLMLF